MWKNRARTHRMLADRSSIKLVVIAIAPIFIESAHSQNILFCIRKLAIHFLYTFPLYVWSDLIFTIRFFTFLEDNLQINWNKLIQMQIDQLIKLVQLLGLVDAETIWKENDFSAFPFYFSNEKNVLNSTDRLHWSWSKWSMATCKWKWSYCGTWVRLIVSPLDCM